MVPAMVVRAVADIEEQLLSVLILFLISEPLLQIGVGVAGDEQLAYTTTSSEALERGTLTYGESCWVRNGPCGVAGTGECSLDSGISSDDLGKGVWMVKLFLFPLPIGLPVAVVAPVVVTSPEELPFDLSVTWVIPPDVILVPPLVISEVILFRTASGIS
jgi:hypothetical protein